MNIKLDNDVGTSIWITNVILNSTVEIGNYKVPYNTLKQIRARIKDPFSTEYIYIYSRGYSCSLDCELTGPAKLIWNTYLDNVAKKVELFIKTEKWEK